LDEARSVLRAGADELYLGAMFDDWARDFGEDAWLTRRQGRTAHVRSREVLRAIVAETKAAGRDVFLACNARYTVAVLDRVHDLLADFEAMGGDGAILTEPVLMARLRRDGSRLIPVVSSLANVTNSASARFFAALGARRIVLPGHLSFAGASAFTGALVDLEFEWLAVYRPCAFVDGLCGFHHALRLPSDIAAEYDHDSNGDTFALLPSYAGHGCQLLGSSGRAPSPAKQPLPNKDHLRQIRITHLKIAGRGEEIAATMEAIKALRQAYGD